jgi:hypothetical protein
MTDQQDKTRREFMAYGSMAAAALALADSVPVPAPTSASTSLAPSGLVAFGCRDDRCLRDFSMGDFAPLVGQSFRVAVGGRATSVQLLKVTPLSQTPISSQVAVRSQPFSLIFSGDHEASLASAIHGLYHPINGPFKIFLSPIGAQALGEPLRYQAVFA